MTSTLPEQPRLAVRNPARDLDAILDRWTLRAPGHRVEFPPDFVHGDATLEEIYDVFGEEWVEGAAFVQHHTDARGRVVAVSVARFSDWFLEVEHFAAPAGPASAEAVRAWTEERVIDRHTVLELLTEPCETPSFTGSRWIDLRCSLSRLIELERRFISLGREGARDWRTIAQTNLLSVIVLAARLGVERLH